MDSDTAETLKTLNKHWRSLGRRRLTPVMTPNVFDRFLLSIPLERTTTIGLNQLVWDEHAGQWPSALQGEIYHRNGDPLDFRFENLELRSVGEKTLRLKAATPPAAPEKGISELPNGQFKVRAYDLAMKKPKYVGLRNTREKAVELKRQFLAGEVGFRSPSA